MNGKWHNRFISKSISPDKENTPWRGGICGGICLLFFLPLLLLWQMEGLGVMAKKPKNRLFRLFALCRMPLQL